MHEVSAPFTAPKDKSVEGLHDLYILFSGEEGEMFDFDWWRAEK